MKDMLNKIILGDCLDVMKNIEDKSVDMILCDLPYGTTACKWDTIIPFDKLWEQYHRIIKSNGAIVLTASQPFTSKLAMSNIDNFKYCWFWIKNRVTGFANAKKQPLRNVEEILIFYKTAPKYNPQGLLKIDKLCKNRKSSGGETLRGNIEESSSKGRLRTAGAEYIQEFTGFPRQAITDIAEEKKVHPTQKPIALMEYLIKTYTKENEIVLDNCIGSGTTAIAAIRTGRKFIGIEKDPEYHRLACERVEKEQQNLFNTLQ